VERLENGMLAITAAGVDRVMEQDSLFLRRDRLLSERAAASQRELTDETAVPKNVAKW